MAGFTHRKVTELSLDLMELLKNFWLGKLVRGYLRKDLHIKKQRKQLQVPKVGAPKKERLLN